MQGEADDEHRGQADLAVGRAAADGQALAEVVETDADGDEESHSPGRGPGINAPGRGLCGGHGARAKSRPRAIPAHQPTLVVDQAYEAGGQASEEERPVPDHRPHSSGIFVEIAERRIHGLPGVRQHVPEQKRQDSHGQGIEELPQAGARRTHAAQGQADHDRAAGD